MKLSSILKSNHDLKKNGYKILRKLHKMETRKGSEKAYATAFNDTYFFVLSARALVDVIRREYPEAEAFLIRCDRFLSYIDSMAEKRSRLNSSVLASFLHAYTVFFNRVIEERHPFVFNQDMIELWNTKCLMAYVATWGSNR